MYGTELNFKRWILRLFTFLFLNWGGSYGIVVKFSFLLTRISCSRYDSISTLVKYYAIPLLTILSIESGLKFLGIRISSNIPYVQNIVMKQVRNENFSSNLKELRTFTGRVTHGGLILLPAFFATHHDLHFLFPPPFSYSGRLFEGGSRTISATEEECHRTAKKLKRNLDKIQTKASIEKTEIEGKRERIQIEATRDKIQKKHK